MLFSDYKQVTYWRIDFTVYTTTSGVITNGTSSLTLKINQPPYNGFCSLSNSNGIAFHTYFTVSCSNWTDADGYVTSYGFFGQYHWDCFKLLIIYINKILLFKQLARVFLSH